MPPSRRLIHLALSLAALFGAGMASAAPARTPPPVTLAVSPTNTALAKELAATLQQKDGISLKLTPVGSERGIEEVRAGRLDAALIARALSPEEAREFHAVTLAHDSLLIVVNERNPLTETDTATIRRIFSREVSEWKQIGLAAGGAIVPVTRRPGDGTRTVFDNAFGIGRVIPTGIIELATNLAAVLAITADPQAIAYVSAEAYEDARRRGLRIHAVRLDGLLPVAADCQNTNYALCRPILLIRTGGKPARGVERVESFLRSVEGRALIERRGFAGAIQQ